jgi:hypothetical protein
MGVIRAILFPGTKVVTDSITRAKVSDNAKAVTKGANPEHFQQIFCGWLSW